MNNYRIEQIPVMGKEDKITYLYLVLGGMVITSIFAVWWFMPSHLPHNFSGVFHLVDIMLFVMLSFIVWHQIIMEVLAWYISLNMKTPKPTFAPPGFKVALMTAFVPGKESYEILTKSLRAMKEVDYPHDTWLLDEGNDPQAKLICNLLGVKHFSRFGIEKYNQPEGRFKAKTKGGNYNAWFDIYAKHYDIVAQHDVDFVPIKGFLTKTLGYFKDPQVAFVGSPQIYGNQEQSWIVRGAAEQAFSFYGPIQKGLFGADMQLFIGANHIVRVKAHDDIGGYSGHIVEDHLTGMKMYVRRWKSVYVPEILAVGEGPASWGAYFSQQMRWAYGLIDILLRHSPKYLPLMRFKHAFNYFMLQQHYFHGLAQGIGVVLILLYFFWGIQATSMELTELILLYMPVLIIQIFVFYFLQKFYIYPSNEAGWLGKSKLLNLAVWPIYLVAFLSVIMKKPLTYKVTPKGSIEKEMPSFKPFIPHFILGTLTSVGIAVSFFTHYQAPQIFFFAFLNSAAMYFFVAMVLIQRLQAMYQDNIYAFLKGLKESWGVRTHADGVAAVWR